MTTEITTMVSPEPQTTALDAAVKKANDGAQQLLGWASALVVTNDEEQAQAAARNKAIKEMRKMAEDEKEFYFRPLKKQCDAITARFKDVLDLLDRADRASRQALARYADEQLQAQRRAEAEERERQQAEALRIAGEREAALKEEQARIAAEAAAKADALRAAGDTENAAAVEEQATAAQEILAEVTNRQIDKDFKAADRMATVSQKVNAGGVSVTTRMVKKWRLTDLTLVPREYLELNEAAVTAAMRAGTPVAGVEFYEEPQVAVR